MIIALAISSQVSVQVLFLGVNAKQLHNFAEGQWGEMAI